uniref:Uncharacterized protein n=1 Tax=Ananas comosus var. bracteatus TaxID=296719 RepID=A0A6V7PFL2_ANACO|nr:unnamed protein product [Ananas comosus var. bracteatus]
MHTPAASLFEASILVLPLSSIDRAANARVSVEFIQVSSRGGSGGAVAAIREGFARALVSYFPVAERIVESVPGEPMVECSGDGICSILLDCHPYPPSPPPPPPRRIRIRAEGALRHPQPPPGTPQRQQKPPAAAGMHVSSTTTNPAPLVIDRTLSSVANLAKLLPTGTVLAFQALSPSFANHGACYPSNKFLTALLLYFCAASCVFFSFTDSLRGRDGKLYYGMATFRGFYVFNYSGGDDDDDRVRLQGSAAAAHPAHRLRPRLLLRGRVPHGGVQRRRRAELLLPEGRARRAGAAREPAARRRIPLQRHLHGLPHHPEEHRLHRFDGARGRAFAVTTHTCIQLIEDEFMYSGDYIWTSIYRK